MGIAQCPKQKASCSNTSRTLVIFFSGPELFVLSTKVWLRKGLSWISCRKTVTLQQLCPEVAYLEPVFLLAYFFLCFPIELHMKWHTHGMLHVLRV